MEAGFDLEDDLFYADLNKQISLLIMDDDDNDQDSLAQYPSLNLQALAQTIHPTNQVSFLNYEIQQTCKRSESKGTGVFIPRSLHPRRKSSKQGKFRASGNRVDKPSEQHARGVAQMTYYDNSSNNNINLVPVPSYQSVNHRTY